VSHVLAQLQLLLFAGLVFALVVRWRVLPLAEPGINLDVDWLWRGLGASVVKTVARVFEIGGYCLGALLSFKLSLFSGMVERHRLPDGFLSRSWPTGSMSLWVMLMLFAYLVLYYLGS
jgi:multicomponent Na+:H+ antiporter subunit D